MNLYIGFVVVFLVMVPLTIAGPSMQHRRSQYGDEEQEDAYPRQQNARHRPQTRPGQFNPRGDQEDSTHRHNSTFWQFNSKSKQNNARLRQHDQPKFLHQRVGANRPNSMQGRNRQPPRKMATRRKPLVF